MDLCNSLKSSSKWFTYFLQKRWKLARCFENICYKYFNINKKLNIHLMETLISIQTASYKNVEITISNAFNSVKQLFTLKLWFKVIHISHCKSCIWPMNFSHEINQYSRICEHMSVVYLYTFNEQVEGSGRNTQISFLFIARYVGMQIMRLPQCDIFPE